MSAFLAGWILPGAVIAGESLLLVAALLLVAMLIYVAQKIVGEQHSLRSLRPRVLVSILKPTTQVVFAAVSEPVSSPIAQRMVFVFGPLLALVMALSCWIVVPVAQGWVLADIDIGLLYLLAVSSLGFYGSFFSGWVGASSGQFKKIMRVALQMVCYRLSSIMALICVLLCAGTLNLSEIVASQRFGLADKLGMPEMAFLNWYGVALFPMFAIFMIASLAEAHRIFFYSQDAENAESEMNKRYLALHGPRPYLVHRLGGNISLALVCSIVTILFLGGWQSPIHALGFDLVPGVVWFTVKAVLVLVSLEALKTRIALFPYEMLMRMGWQLFLPLSVVYMLLVAAVLLATGWGA